MPIRCGPGKGRPRYRVTTQGGKKVRLAFCGSEVVERMALSSKQTTDLRKRKRRKRPG